jgi:hypothetical protein
MSRRRGDTVANATLERLLDLLQEEPDTLENVLSVAVELADSDKVCMGSMAAGTKLLLQLEFALREVTGEETKKRTKAGL